jgi:hypothetical protein
MIVSVNDILDHLVARSAAPSTFGAQLDRLRFGTHSAPDPFRARDDAENHMLEQASLLRCIADFEQRQEFGSRYGTLERIQRGARLPQGYIAIGILRAYHEWSSQSEERGLVEVYRYIATHASAIAPGVPKGETDLHQAFRTGKAKRARNLAAEAYADALLALQAHVSAANRKRKK